MPQFPPMRVCFYAAVKDRRLFELVEFYKQDIDILRKLGHEVVTANRPRDVWGPFDFYWVWWQTSGVPALAAAALRRRPRVLVTAQSSRDPTPSGLAARSPLARAAAAASMRLTELTLATSEDTRLGLIATASRPVIAAPLGVDTNVYRPMGERDDATVLTISHLTKTNVARKRLLDVVRIAALLPELCFLIVGAELDGATLVREEITRLGVEDRVKLFGEVSPAEKRRLLSCAALYLQPTRYEGFGMAIAEAMASGTPVVSNAVVNVPDLVWDTGVVARAGASVGDLAEHVRGLTSDKQREARGQAARKRVEELFSLDRRAAIVADVLTRMRRPRHAELPRPAGP